MEQLLWIIAKLLVIQIKVTTDKDSLIWDELEDIEKVLKEIE